MSGYSSWRSPVTRLARRAVQRTGWDVVRATVSEPERHLTGIFRQLAVSVVIDVGANDGGYATSIRRFGYEGRIVSFEPSSSVFRQLATAAARDNCWDVRNCALGPSPGTVEINVAGNAGHSSSVLDMLERHLASAPQSRYVGSETVRQQTLESVVFGLDVPPSEIFVKLDVQGYEAQVLAGAEPFLDQFAGIQVEVSLQALYDGAPHYLDLLSSLERRGYRTVQIFRGFGNAIELLQADFVLIR